MDTSETYILMCQKATEIQDGDEHGGMWLTHLGNDILLDTGTDRLYYVKDIHCDHTCPQCGESHDRIERSEYTWLPRQGQLQAMLEGLVFTKWRAKAWDRPSIHILQRFYDFVVANLELKTWEQLWLAFVMKEKYGKRWTGGDWE